MPQPALHREGYAIFVRCCDLSAETPVGQFVSTIEALDRILFSQIGKHKENFFPSPQGGAIYCPDIGSALKAARALVAGLGESGISAAVGVAWGRFQRTVNVHEWNAAALPLNQAARLAFSDAAKGRVLVTPHVRKTAGPRVGFSDQQQCEVKGVHHSYHAIELAEYQQRISTPCPAATTPETDEANIVLWDIVKYSTKDPDEQAELCHSLAISATTALDTFRAGQKEYSPTGDGGFALFASGLRAIEFTRSLGKHAVSRGLTIRTGIGHGEVAFTKRGPVGPGVLSADAISAQAPPKGIAILASVWTNLQKIARDEWRPTEIAPGILSLKPTQGSGPAFTPVDPFASVPPLEPSFIERPELSEPLREKLLSGSGTVSLTAIEGMGGVGKTMVALGLCHDPRVRQAFPNGIVWLTIGRESGITLKDRVQQVALALNQESSVYSEAAYRSFLKDKAVLVVLDDVWKLEDVEPFRLGDGHSRLLYTSRDKTIAGPLGADSQDVGELDETQARRFLGRWSGRESTPVPEPFATGILTECKGLALGLAMVGAALKGQPDSEWGHLLADLKEARLKDLGTRPAGYGYETLHASIAVSVNALYPTAKTRYLRLAVLLEDMAAPEVLLQALWGSEERDVHRTARLFVDRSMAQRDAEGNIRLHDFQLDYVRGEHADAEALALEHAALQLSSHVVRVHPEQFASQMVGRLLPHRDTPAIQQFIDEIAAGSPKPWLRPLQPALHPPGTELLRILGGHSSYVSGVAVTPDGRRAVSASGDRTLKVWDLDTGRALRTLEGHSDSVRGVAVTPDGKRAVSASSDNTLKVWDLETGRALRTLEGHSDSVSGVAVTPDGKWAVSASSDNTLKVWDLETGRALSTLEGHSDSVSGVAVTPDGKWAVSASWDRTLKVWDLDTGRALRTLEGHSDSVSGVAVTPDGKWAVSAHSDKTLKVWDLETGRALHTLEGHSSSVSGVAVTPDGKWAVSASWDHTLKVWDLETGRALSTLEGHSDSVRGVAVTPDGKRAVSASDNTLKVWDLETGLLIATFHCDGAALCCAFADEQRIVAGDGGGRLCFLRLEESRAHLAATKTKA